MSFCCGPYVPAPFGGAQPGGLGIAIAAGTQTATSGTVIFSNSNGFAFGMAGSLTITASLNQSVISAIKSISGGTTHATGFGVSFANGSGVSWGVNGNTITASVAAQTTQPVALSAGGASFTFGTAVFSNLNGVSFGAAGSTITASVAAQTTQPVALSVAGSSVAFGTIVFSNLNNVTFGLNGSTVTASAASQTDFSYQNFVPGEFAVRLAGGINQSSLFLAPYQFPNLVFSQVGVQVTFSADVASVGTMSLTNVFGIYTRNVSTLSLMHSTSYSTTLGYNTGASSAQLNGIRDWTAAWTSTVSQGDYWVGVIMASTTSSQNASISQVFVSAGIANNFSGHLGVASNASNQMLLGLGFFSAATGALPTSIAFSDVRGTVAAAVRMPFFELGAASV